MPKSTFNSLLAVFSFFLFLAGAVLTVLTIYAQNTVPESCTNKNVHLGLNIMLMVSVIITVIPLMQVFCHWGCGCPQMDLSYKLWIIMISLVMAVGSSLVIYGLNADKSVCTNSNTKNTAIGILAFSIVMILLMIFLYSRSSVVKGATKTLVKPTETIPAQNKPITDSSSDTDAILNDLDIDLMN